MELTRKDVVDIQNAMFPDKTLPQICLELRMGVNGSADEWEPSDVLRTIKFLKLRLSTWRESDSKVDEDVRSMIKHTIEEVDAFVWWKSEAREYENGTLGEVMRNLMSKGLIVIDGRDKNSVTFRLTEGVCTINLGVVKANVLAL